MRSCVFSVILRDGICGFIGKDICLPRSHRSLWHEWVLKLLSRRQSAQCDSLVTKDFRRARIQNSCSQHSSYLVFLGSQHSSYLFPGISLLEIQVANKPSYCTWQHALNMEEPKANSTANSLDLGSGWV